MAFVDLLEAAVTRLWPSGGPLAPPLCMCEQIAVAVGVACPTDRSPQLTGPAPHRSAPQQFFPLLDPSSPLSELPAAEQRGCNVRQHTRLHFSCGNLQASVRAFELAVAPQAGGAQVWLGDAMFVAQLSSQRDRLAKVSELAARLMQPLSRRYGGWRPLDSLIYRLGERLDPMPWAARFMGCRRGDGVGVRMDTLDRTLRLRDVCVDAMKIDAEDSEPAILRGAQQLLSDPA